MNLLVTLAVLFLVTSCVSTCDCRHHQCPRLNCRGGIVKDGCNCCEECAKLEGEECGGLSYRLGKCDTGFYCHETGHVLSGGTCRSLKTNWVTDAATGKQYIVLETSTLNFDLNKRRCGHYSAILPEPRSEEENNFLDSLDAQLFPLGLNDNLEEGVWRWTSDGSLVTWFYWANFKTYGLDPNGGKKENCVAMIKHHSESDLLTSSASWVDIPCEQKQIATKNLVCQKVEDYYTFW